MPPGALLTKVQVGKLFGVCAKTIERWVYRLNLPCVKFGPGRAAIVRFDPVEVDKWVDQWRKGEGDGVSSDDLDISEEQY